MSDVRACLVGVTAYLPERWVDMAEREAQIVAASGGFVPPPGLLTQLTGVQGVHLIGDDQQASDLAVNAARKLLADCGAGPEGIDLMIFAAASQDLAEPATSHIVAAQLGLNCPVFDVKNACNSVLNAIEITQALISSGQYRRVLITCGEAPSLYARLRIADASAFARSLPSFGFSDAGAALLWEAGEEAGIPSQSRGVLGARFAADSAVWPCATVLHGGTRTVRQVPGESAFFQMESTRIRDSLHFLCRTHLPPLLDELGLDVADFSFIGVHQVSLSDLDDLCAAGFGIPREKLVISLPRHGNVASASLPLQLATAIDSGLAGPGDLVALIGLAAGSSAGLAVIRL
ncbi:3-oxoacyl-[acyl-carrier-protein] synthase III C-terminal domain-containing protein [Streptomyces sp. NPDC005236]|uniref:3-oxoacyl-ACP synthase III family protein n=1 Tax=Streptomyces sp. NPDC005236 TaxID=3157028 RepID=UPI0033A98A6C